MRRATHGTTSSEQDLAVGDLEVKVKRHPSARRMTLRVSHVRREVVLTMPAFSSMAEAGRFVNLHMDWVKERLHALPEPVPFSDGRLLPYRSKPYVVRFVEPDARRPFVYFDGILQARRERCDAVRRGELPTRAGTMEKFLPRLCVVGNRRTGPERLGNWLAIRAKEALKARVEHHAEYFGVEPLDVTVRDQRSRWGSCASSGLLSFSWRLILAPPFVLDYVAAHEVAHLREMNHGARFWRLVDRAVPRLEAARQWLHDHGAELHRYGPSPG